MVSAGMVIALGQAALIAQASTPPFRFQALDAKLQPTGPLRLSPPAGATSTAVRFYIRQRGRPKEEVEGAVLETDQLRGLTIKVDGANAKGRFTVPAHPGLVPATATFDGANAPQSQKGSILIRKDASGESKVLVKVVTTRKPKDAVGIEGAGDDGFALKRSVSEFEQDFDIVAKGDDSVGDLQLGVDAFTDDHQGRVEPQVLVGSTKLVDEKRYTVAPDSPLILTVRALLPAKGEHRSRIVMRYAGQRVLVPVTVTRETRVAGLEVADVPSSRVELGKFGRTASATFPIDLRETDGRDTQLETPRLVLLRKDGTESLKVDEHGFTIDTRPPAPVLLAAGAPKTLTAGLEGLEPGQYTAQVKLPAGEGAPKRASATIFVRRSVVDAGLAIGLGAILSGFVRFFWVRKRDQIRARQAVAQLAGDIDRVVQTTNPKAGEANAVAALRAKLVSVDQKLRDNPAEDVKADLDAVRERVPVLSRYITLANAAETADVKDKVLGKLDAAADYLAFGSASATNAGTALDEVAAYLRKTPGLETAIHELAKAREAWIGEHPGNAAGSAADVGKHVDDANGAFHRDDMAEAEKSYQAGWGALTTAAADELRGLVGSPDPPPGLDQDEWDTLAETIRDATADIGGLAPAEAVERYREAYKTYLTALAKGMRKRVRSQLELAKTNNEAAKIAALTELDELLAEVERHVAADDLQRARKAYEDAKRKWSVNRDSGLLLGPSAGTPDNPPANSGSTLTRPAPAGTAASVQVTAPTSSLPTSADLAGKLWRIELLVGVLAGVAAVASGIVLLYYAKADWGSPEDVLVAVLWGLGLHQIGTVAFPGLAATADTIAGVPRPAA
jgi:hypothetical protein